jgi:glycogen(starch) synthase
MASKARISSCPLKVLMTADTVGGVWSYTIGLCASQPEIRFVVATMGPRPRQAQHEQIAQLDNVVLEESDYGLEWMADGDADFVESRNWLVGLVRRHGIGLVHVNGYAHASLGIEVPVLVVAHSDVLSWWEAVHHCAAPSDWDRYRRRATAGLTAANRIAAPTATVLQDLERHYMDLDGKGEVIANGVDTAAFPPLLKRPVVLGAGRVWDNAKNLAALDAIAEELAWPVELAGDAAHPESGSATFEAVRILGLLCPAEMARHLGHASIFVAPARYEPFGLTILEAAAARCALVLGDIPSLRENWAGAAVFVDPEDKLALRSSINRLICHAEERTHLAAAAQCRAKRFTLHRMGRAYAALYRDMALSSACLDRA